MDDRNRQNSSTLDDVPFDDFFLSVSSKLAFRGAHKGAAEWMKETHVG